MGRKRLFILLLAALLAIISANSLLSQIRARVDLVVVPVSVRDNNGVLITGLQREDFMVYEDGKEQTITSFSVDAQPLSAAIVIDDGMSGKALKQAVSVLPALTGAFTPEDEVASFRYDHLVWKLSDFTNDRKQLQASFAELERIGDSRPVEPEQPELYSKIEKKTPAVLRSIAKIFSMGSNGAPQAGTSTAPAPKTAPDSRVMHSAVHEAAMLLQDRSPDRRKIIILVSNGEVSEPQTSVIPGETLHSFSQNADLLGQSEIQVYAVNMRASLLEKSSGQLESYAGTTGGDVYGGLSESDTEFAFKRLVEQARTQYVLGYVSNNAAPPLGVYRKIEVKSGDPDQQREVTYRQGYMQFPIPK